MEGYKVVYEGKTGEIVEKKSRFIATLRPVETEEEALAFIQEMKKQYWDARHNCSAYVIGRNQDLQRCSDDGEPSQTAGRPMLDVLLKEGIHNTAVVVTRYFGGTLLGTGGLVRAYQKAVQEGLGASTIITKQEGQALSIYTDYTGLGKIQYILAQKEIPLMDTLYTEQVEIQAMIPLDSKEEILEEITEGTNGAARYQWGKKMEFCILNKKIKFFEKKG